MSDQSEKPSVTDPPSAVQMNPEKVSLIVLIRSLTVPQTVAIVGVLVTLVGAGYWFGQKIPAIEIESQKSEIARLKTEAIAPISQNQTRVLRDENDRLKTRVSQLQTDSDSAAKQLTSERQNSADILAIHELRETSFKRQIAQLQEDLTDERKSSVSLKDQRDAIATTAQTIRKENVQLQLQLEALNSQASDATKHVDPKIELLSYNSSVSVVVRNVSDSPVFLLNLNVDSYELNFRTSQSLNTQIEPNSIKEIKLPSSPFGGRILTGVSALELKALRERRQVFEIVFDAQNDALATARKHLGAGLNTFSANATVTFRSASGGELKKQQIECVGIFSFFP